MGIKMTTMARQLALLETKENIEHKDDSKHIAKALHEHTRGQLKLRDAEKWRAAKIKDVQNTIQVVQSAVTVAQKAKGVVNEAQNLDQKIQQEMDQQKPREADRAEKPEKLDEPADERKRATDETKDIVKNAMMNVMQEQIVDGIMEKFQHAEKQAHERAGRHEELAGEVRDVKTQVRDDAYAQLAEVRAIEHEGFMKSRNADERR